MSYLETFSLTWQEDAVVPGRDVGLLMPSEVSTCC